MAWTPIVGKQMSIPEFQKYVNGLRFDSWRPSFVVLHNTGAPFTCRLDGLSRQ